MALILASVVGLQSVPAAAQAIPRPEARRDHVERRWDHRDDRRDDRRDRERERREEVARRELERRELQRREVERRAEARAEARAQYWDAARYYRHDDRRYEMRRLGRNDRIYRGSDNRYYCRRDDGTTGLIVGGIAGGVLGNLITPGGWKTLGTIAGAGGGALIGRAIDRGDVVCR